MSGPTPPNGPIHPPPPGGRLGPPQPWPQYPHGQWSTPPPKRGNGWKWVVGAVALLAAVGVTAAVTLSVAGGDEVVGDEPSRAAPNQAHTSNTRIASADDTGPITVITDEPSCAPVRPILETRAHAQRNGWDRRDPAVPATEWTPDVREQFEAVGESMRVSADQLVPIAEMTPHRVMRELYEQLIAYSRAYADAIPTYVAVDNNLAVVANSISEAISSICAAIDFKSAAARAPLVPPLSPPDQVPPLGDLSQPQRYLTEPNPVCEDWASALAAYQSEIKPWTVTSPDIPAGQWSNEQKRLTDDVIPVMQDFAREVNSLGEESGNGTLRDVAQLSAQYRNAYVAALPTYVPADKYLLMASNYLVGVVNAACRAVAE